jgi:hypothetical protein
MLLRTTVFVFPFAAWYRIGCPGMFMKALLPNAEPVHEGTALAVSAPPLALRLSVTVVPSGRLNVKFWPFLPWAVVST